MLVLDAGGWEIPPAKKKIVNHTCRKKHKIRSKELIYILAIVAVITAIAFIIGYYYFGKDSLYVLGIGAAVSSNVYNVGSYGIEYGGLIWGVDAVIYTLFAFCIIVALKDYGKKSAMAITYSSMAGIMLTAIFDFLAKWMSVGFGEDLLWGFLSYAFSTIATFVAITVAILVFESLKEKLHNAINMCLSILIVSIINSLIYFGLTALVGGLGSDFGIMLAGSYIVKVIALLFFVATYYVYEIFNKKRLNKI